MTTNKTTVKTEKGVKSVGPLVTKAQLYSTTEQIEKAVAEATRNGVSLQVAYQKIAASAVLHLGQHKDIRIIRNILDTMPESLRRSAMTAYFDMFASAKLIDNQFHYDDSKPTKLGEALETAWWKTVKEAEYRPFVLVDELEGLYNRALKRLEKADPAKGDAVTANQLQALHNMINQVKSPQANQPVRKTA